MSMFGGSSSAESNPGEFREVSHVGAGRRYTTLAMVRMEQEIVVRIYSLFFWRTIKSNSGNSVIE